MSVDRAEAGGLSPTLGRIESVCDRFEAAWRCTPWPRIEEYWSESDGTQLLRELLVLDVVYRLRHHDHPNLGEYQVRFPAHDGVIRSAFEAARMSVLPADSHSSTTWNVADTDVRESLTPLDGFNRANARVEAVDRALADVAIAGALRFRVLRPLAKGGLGEVFVARDEELRREVALKLIQEQHADDTDCRDRFLFEAEITGRLEHPGVIPVYGLGVDGNGRPYYAMRFIRGESLKESIARFHRADGAVREPGERSLALRELLGRFIDVCNTIAYAHGRGVLHRDLKPANVMLGDYGETLVVDWGLAKITGRPDGELVAEDGTQNPEPRSGTHSTKQGSWLGTPSFMSPEQAAGRIDLLGPASDIYSLGATLYNLLTGKSAFEGTDVLTVLSQVQEGTFASPRSLEPRIDRALEAVCLKAMAKKPEDRYATCRALAEDVERWTADEPVTAWREPFSRQARRWARRHRTPVAAAVVALVAGLVALGTVAGVQARANDRLRRAYAATNTALGATRQAQAETQTALAQSEESRQQAEAVSTFLVQAFRSPDPAQDGRTVKVADVLDRASERLDKEFLGSEASKGAMLDALGTTYRGLGLYARSVSLHTKARAVREATLGSDHPDTLNSRHNLATAYWVAARLPEAIALFETTQQLRESKLGPDHPDTLKTRSNLAGAYRAAGRLTEAIALQDRMLKQMETKLGPNHLDALKSSHNLANAYRVAGRLPEAIALHEKTLKQTEIKLGPDHAYTLAFRNGLATAYMDTGRTSEATALFERTLEVREAKLGADHPDTLRSRNNLAVAYNDAGRLSEAIELYEKTLKLFESKLGPDQPETLGSRDNLAVAYNDAGRTSEAIALHETTLALYESKLGLDHPDTLANRHNLANAYVSAGRLSEAIALFESTLKLRESKLGPDHRDTLMSRGKLASSYESLGRWAKAEGLYRETLARRRKTVQPDSPFLADDLAALGHHLLVQSRWSEAEPLLREGLAIRLKSSPDDWVRYDAMSLLGASLVGQGRYALAEPLLVRGYEGTKARESRIIVPKRSRLREAAERVIRLYEEWNKPDQSTAWKAKVGMRDLPADVFVRP